MKQLIAIVVLSALILKTANATNYYFSYSTGNDSYSSTQARNPSTPWRTIGKLNSIFSSLQPGDSVLFKRGDTFFGEIIISRSGASTGRIYLAAYGSGAKPIITGFQTVSSWTSYGSGIYESVFSPGQSTLNMVTRNNAFQAIGRWPKANAANSGYLLYQSHSGTTSITSNAISSARNYVGGEVVIRATHYDLNRGKITAQSSTTVAYSMIPGGSTGSVFDGFGFFFQNHVNTLTALGDWCYDPSTKKIRMYFGTASPTSYWIKASAATNNVTIASRAYITFYGLAFTGSNSKAFNITGSNNITINSCDITFAGINGISTNSACSSIYVANSTFSYINNNAIDANYATYYTVTNNTFSNIGVTAGMGLTGDGQYIVGAYIGSNSLIQYNTVNNAGYHGFQFADSPVTIQNNFINNFCLLKDDGGGIYTYKNTSAGVKTIKNNIVINGIGAPNGTNGIMGGGAVGIYADMASDNVQILNNSVANCQQLGIDVNDGQSDVISGNTVYNCGTPYGTQDGGGGQIAITHWSGGQGVRNVTLTNNIFCAVLTIGQGTMRATTPSNDLNLFFGTADYNYYARPLANATPVFTRLSAPAWLNVTQWGTAIGGKELHSKSSPKTVSSASSLRFEYNASTSNKTVNLGTSYIDMKGTSYPGTITLAPYTSAVLILSSATTAQAEVPTEEVAAPTPLRSAFIINPNPVADNFTLGLNNDYTGKLTVQIINEAGQLIQSFSYDKDQQNLQINVPSRDLATGVYFVHVQIGNWSDTKKILKQP